MRRSQERKGQGLPSCDSATPPTIKISRFSWTNLAALHQVAVTGFDMTVGSRKVIF
jgi:hypothetical protein